MKKILYIISFSAVAMSALVLLFRESTPAKANPSSIQVVSSNLDGSLLATSTGQTPASQAVLQNMLYFTSSTATTTLVNFNTENGDLVNVNLMTVATTGTGGALSLQLQVSNNGTAWYPYDDRVANINNASSSVVFVGSAKTPPLFIYNFQTATATRSFFVANRISSKYGRIVGTSNATVSIYLESAVKKQY